MWTRQMQRDVTGDEVQNASNQSIGDGQPISSLTWRCICRNRTANGGHYSIKFWMKPLDNFLDSFDAAQPLTLYQSLSPPVLLTTIYISKTGRKLQVSFCV
jgi:hypothetical protein